MVQIVEYKKDSDGHHFTWPIVTFPARAVADCSRELYELHVYSTFNPAAIQAIENAAKRYKIPVDIVQNIFSAQVRQKSNLRANLIRAQIAKISEAYKTQDIISLSELVDYPPSLLWGMIMLQTNDKELVKSWRMGKICPIGRDGEQLALATQADLNGGEQAQKATTIGYANEQIFVKYFRDLGIKLQSEDDLRATNVQGRTPDILFGERVSINKHELKWIDFKNYFGFNQVFLASKNKKQAAQTTAEFGPGAIVYRAGVAEDLKMPEGVMILSGIPIAEIFQW